MRTSSPQLEGLEVDDVRPRENAEMGLSSFAAHALLRSLIVCAGSRATDRALRNVALCCPLLEEVNLESDDYVPSASTVRAFANCHSLRVLNLCFDGPPWPEPLVLTDAALAELPAGCPLLERVDLVGCPVGKRHTCCACTALRPSVLAIASYMWIRLHTTSRPAWLWSPQGAGH